MICSTSGGPRRRTLVGATAGVSAWLVRSAARSLRTAPSARREASIEVVKRGAHGLDRLQYDFEPFADRRKPGRRVRALSVWHEALSMSAALALASCSAARLARCASVGCTVARSRPSANRHAGLRGPQLCASEPGSLPRLVLALVLAERGKACLLFVVQEAVELLQRRLHACRPPRSSPRCALHGGEPVRRRQRDVGRTGRLDVLRGLHRGIGEISSAARCASFGWIACWIWSIGRPAMSRLSSPHICDTCPVRHALPAAADAGDGCPGTACVLRQIAGEVVIV